MKMNSVVQKIVPVAAKIQNNKFLKAISSAFMITMPALMVGAIFSLLKSFPFGEGYTDFLANTKLDIILNAGVDATTNLIALYVIVALGYNMGKALELDKFMSAIIALMSFIMVTPFSTTVMDSAENTIPVNSVLPMNWLGAQGIFTALIVGIISSLIYSFIAKRNWKIKLPDSVPPNVSEPFEAIVPAFIILTFFLIVRSAFSFTSYGSLSQFIYSMLSVPLTGLGNSLAAFIICLLVIHILWLIGVHGTIVAVSVMLAIWTGPMMENQAALTAGQPIPYMLTGTFLFAIMQWLGGPGCMIGLTTNMAFFAKSQRYKTLGKLSLAPSIFNIIEPVIYGFPLVLNPIMAIPFILTPLIEFILGYILMNLHIIGIPAIPLPTSVFTMPFIPGGFLLGAGVSFGIFMIAMAVLSFLIYYPFFKVADRIALKEEKEQSTLSDSKTAE